MIVIHKLTLKEFITSRFGHEQVLKSWHKINHVLWEITFYFLSNMDSLFFYILAKLDMPMPWTPLK